MGLGTIGSDLVAAIVITSLLRRPLGHAAWRGVHWLAYAAWPVAASCTLNPAAVKYITYPRRDADSSSTNNTNFTEDC